PTARVAASLGASTRWTSGMCDTIPNASEVRCTYATGRGSIARVGSGDCRTAAPRHHLPRRLLAAPKGKEGSRFGKGADAVAVKRQQGFIDRSRINPAFQLAGGRSRAAALEALLQFVELLFCFACYAGIACAGAGGGCGGLAVSRRSDRYGLCCGLC